MRLIFLCFLLPLLTTAQDSERAILKLTPDHFAPNASQVYAIDGTVLETYSLPEQKTAWINIPIEADPFLAFSVVWKNTESDALAIYYRFSEKEKEWTKLKEDPHHTKTDGSKVGQLIFADKMEQKIQIKLEGKELGNKAIEFINLHFFNPGKTTNPSEQIKATNRQSCPCPQPDFLDRQGWCPTGNCAEHPNPQTTEVTHLIVHHAASTNASSDWSGVVRSIWDFHVNTNGWDDIGYNWLIDPNGVVYEGRGDNIQGAHFCGNNGGTTGICMLGDFTNTVPTTAAVDQLTAFLSWKACDKNLDPEGSAFHASSGQNLPLIAGHRDGCSTECPGNQFYPLFAQVRTSVKNFQDQNCEEFAPPTNLTAWATSPSNIQLQWQDNSEIETEFLVERSKNNNESFTQIAQLPNNSTFFTDTGLTPFTAYFYRVRAAAASNYSDYSNEYGVATVLTDLDQIEKEATKAEVIPNPSNGPIRLSLKGAYRGRVQLKLYDLAHGRIQQQWTLDKTDFSLDQELILKKVGTGVFVLRIEMEQEIVHLKVLKVE